MTVVTVNLSAENTFSDVIKVSNKIRYSLNVATAFVGTVTAQKRFSDSGIWRDLTSFTGNYEDWDEEPGGAQFRFGIKTGDYTSGDIDIRLDDARI